MVAEMVVLQAGRTGKSAAELFAGATSCLTGQVIYPIRFFSFFGKRGI
jgi:hypothetical protein